MTHQSPVGVAFFVPIVAIVVRSCRHSDLSASRHRIKGIIIPSLAKNLIKQLHRGIGHRLHFHALASGLSDHAHPLQ
jgi:hypothetical protein